MQQQGGYAAQTRLSPTGLGIVLALHAGALAAILLAPPEMMPAPIKHLIVYAVPDSPPPPPEAQPEPEPQAQRQEVIKPVERVVEVPLSGLADESIMTRFPPPVEPKPVALPEPASTRMPVFVGATVDPARARDFQPDYPPSLMREGVTGRVVVRVRIGTDGRVKEVERVSASDPLFFEATRRQALTRWRFVAATRDGSPVESWREMTVRFEMPD